MSETTRCFLAMELTEAVQRSLEEVITRLNLPPFDVRWVQPRNMHLTLRFLGEITREEAVHVSGAARKAAAETPPLRVRLRGLGTFPPSGSPRVVWLGLADPGPVVRLERALGRELGRLGRPPPDNPFRAHLTLGRVKSRRGIEELRRHLQRLGAVETDEMTVESIGLIRSVLRPSGPLYTVLERFELGAIATAREVVQSI